MFKALFLIGLAAEAARGAGSIYPVSTFIRTIHQNAIFEDTYCMETGKPGTAQGVKNQWGQPVQACEIGLLRVPVWNGNQTALSFDLNGAASVVDLGTFAELAARYNLEPTLARMMWTSIHFSPAHDQDREAFLIMKTSTAPLTYQPLLERDVLPLKTSTVNTMYTMTPGRIYLVRLTSRPGTSPTLVADTTMFAKLQVLQAPSLEPHQPLVVQWDVFWGDSKFVAADSSRSETMRNWALGLSIISFLGLVGVSICLCTKARNTVQGYQPM